MLENWINIYKQNLCTGSFLGFFFVLWIFYFLTQICGKECGEDIFYSIHCCLQVSGFRGVFIIRWFVMAKATNLQTFNSAGFSQSWKIWKYQAIVKLWFLSLEKSWKFLCWIYLSRSYMVMLKYFFFSAFLETHFP